MVVGGGEEEGKIFEDVLATVIPSVYLMRGGYTAAVLPVPKVSLVVFPMMNMPVLPFLRSGESADEVDGVPANSRDSDSLGMLGAGYGKARSHSSTVGCEGASYGTDGGVCAGAAASELQKLPTHRPGAYHGSRGSFRAKPPLALLTTVGLTKEQILTQNIEDYIATLKRDIKYCCLYLRQLCGKVYWLVSVTVVQHSVYKYPGDQTQCQRDGIRDRGIFYKNRVVFIRKCFKTLKFFHPVGSEISHVGIFRLWYILVVDISAFENRMLMLDGMPAVRVKTELLESEQGLASLKELRGIRPKNAIGNGWTSMSGKNVQAAGSTILTISPVGMSARVHLSAACSQRKGGSGKQARISRGLMRQTAFTQSPNVHNYPDMDAVPLLLNNMKADPTEDSLSTDHFQTQTEPVDLSINKARSSPTAASSSPVSMTASASSPSSTSTSSSSSRPASSPTVITSVSSAASVPSVLTPGPLVASASGVGGQQFLHIIHPVPPSSPMNLQSNKMSHVHRIPVVVQSVPVVYTAVRSPGNMNNTIVVPLLEDGRSHVKGKVEPVLCICGISETGLIKQQKGRKPPRVFMLEMSFADIGPERHRECEGRKRH
ncbi:hypothetical protein EK904_003177, partial [Melospiza melodia maxima]